MCNDIYFNHLIAEILFAVVVTLQDLIVDHEDGSSEIN